MKQYFEVEVEYSGTKIFKVPVEINQSLSDAVAYIAANYERFEHDYNPVIDMTDNKLITLNYREEK
jgi:hypothetical protein